MEQWRIVEMDERYLVSDSGRVRGINGKILKPYIIGKGYHGVRIGEVSCQVHVLVADAFIPNPNNLPEINHIDEVKTHNMLFNLERCTRLHNIEHSFCYPFAVIDPDGTVWAGRNQSRFAEEHGLHPRTFRKLVAGTVKNHKGWRVFK